MMWFARLIFTAVFASGAFLCAQDTPQRNVPAPSATSACDPDSVGRGSPLEVLTDTAGADFGPYLWGVTRKIRPNWHEAIPPEARTPSSNKGCVTVEFSIDKSGRPSGAKVVQTSGDATLERAALAGIAASAPFDPLPKEFPGDALSLRFHFRYDPQRGRLGSLRQGGEWHSTHDNPESATESAPPETYHGDPVYKVGRGVTPPKGTYMPTPEFTEEARKKKLQGTVLVAMIVTADGTTDQVKVVRGFDPGLDQKAIDTVRRWTFTPGTKDGKPVPVHIDVEVSFRLY